jgi:hypothetical protein
LGNLRERDHLEDLGIDGRIILKWILKKYDGWIQTGYVWHSTETSGGLFTTHTYMPFHFINPSKPLGFGYETCPQDLTNTIRCTQIETYTHTHKL